jgi:hypothetical protein
MNRPCGSGGSGLRDQLLAGWWRCHEVHVDDFEPEAGDPLNEPGQGRLIGQFGAEGCHSAAYGDIAIVEFRTQGGTRLARESDLICL